MNERQEFRRLEALAKLLLLVMIGLIIAEFGSCAREAKAGVVTGEKQLGGASYWIQQYIEAEGHSPYTEDIELIAECIYHENWHTDKDHLAAYYTGAVILNRVMSKNFPNTVKGVLYQTKPTVQYSTTDKFFTETLPCECYEMAREIVKYGTPDVPRSVVYQAMFRQGSGLWKKINTDYFCYE